MYFNHYFCKWFIIRKSTMLSSWVLHLHILLIYSDFKFVHWFISTFLYFLVIKPIFCHWRSNFWKFYRIWDCEIRIGLFQLFSFLQYKRSFLRNRKSSFWICYWLILRLCICVSFYFQYSDFSVIRVHCFFLLEGLVFECYRI